MAMKEYVTLLKAPELEPHHQMQFSVILRKLLWSGWLSLCRVYKVFYIPSTRLQSFLGHRTNEKQIEITKLNNLETILKKMNVSYNVYFSILYKNTPYT